jgi:hypothetical protein
MNKHQQFTTIIERDGDGYMPLYPQPDIASQGLSNEGDALANISNSSDSSVYLIAHGNFPNQSSVQDLMKNRALSRHAVHSRSK